MTGITADGIEIERDIAAPPSAVFAAWTSADSFARWFGGPDVEVPRESLDFVAEPGRTWAAQMRLPGDGAIDWAGDIIEATPSGRFVFTITDQPGNPERARVVVELTELAGVTRLRFAQESPGFTDEQKTGLIAGWEGFIDELAKIATA